MEIDKTTKNRDEINNLLHSNLPLELIYMRIRMAARDINSYEHSVKLIATEADNYLKDLGI